MKLRNLPTRLATGAFIAHTGWEKLHTDEQQAKDLHGMAAGAYPFLGPVPAPTFVRALSIGELTTGALLLAPFVSPVVAGAALTVFSGGLVTMYLRTPTLHKPGSVWPTRQGIAVSKDVWMLGIGLGLVAGGLGGKEAK
jgi:uncharacterized membrane protein YphA (DoxX/SURF4 family)